MINLELVISSKSSRMIIDRKMTTLSDQTRSSSRTPDLASKTITQELRITLAL